MRSSLNDFLEVNVADFEMKLKGLQNPSFVSKLLELYLSLEQQCTQRTQLKLVRRIITLLQEEIKKYSKNDKENQEHYNVPLVPLPVALLLFGVTFNDLHNFVKEVKDPRFRRDG